MGSASKPPLSDSIREHARLCSSERMASLRLHAPDDEPSLRSTAVYQLLGGEARPAHRQGSARPGFRLLPWPAAVLILDRYDVTFERLDRIGDPFKSLAGFVSVRAQSPYRST